MQTQFQIDMTEVSRLFANKNVRFMRAVKSSWNRASLYFIADIVKNQMSGRKSQDFGLNVRHGQLRRSWFPLTEVTADDVVSRIQTDSSYARIHQYGGIVKHPTRERTLTFRRTRKGTKFAKNKQVTSAGRVTKVFHKVVQTGAYNIKIPKRLYILEAFKTSGLKLYLTGLREALQTLKQGAK